MNQEHQRFRFHLPDIRRLSLHNLILQNEIRRGLVNPTYGTYFERMINFGRNEATKGKLDPRLVEESLGIASTLFRLADNGYRKGNNPLTGEALAKHQENVMNGIIQLVPEESAMTTEESINLVQRADSLLQNTAIQSTLSAINYGAFFKPQTMASATRTLDRGQIDDLLKTVASSHEAMPHVTVSNWAIGQTVAGLYESLAKNPSGKLRVIDIGSGTGSTLAAITSSLNNIHTDRKPQLSITGIEPTPEFFDELTSFIQNDRGVTNLGLDKQINKNGSASSLSSFGYLTAIHGNALETLKQSDLKKGMGESDITVVTANASLHRLNSSAKKAIMSLFRDVPNTIFVIGDLIQNSSAINRRYFNLGVNGPLNCGNLGLSESFQEKGYTLVNIDNKRPASMDSRLASSISYEDKTDDWHLWIAYHGNLAAQALNLVDVQ